MSTPDFSTALLQIKQANAEFLTLITQIRDFLTTDKELSFVLGNETIVVQGILALIDAYKNGSFESITIDGGSTGVVLSMDTDGNLRVEDKGGNLVKVVCTGISASEITSSTMGSVTAQDCNIQSATGNLNVYGGNVTLDSLNVQDELNVTSAVAKNVSGTNVTAENSYTTDLYIQGDRRMAFNDERKVFFDGGAPVDNFASKMSAGYSDSVWNWASSPMATPAMLGIYFSTDTIPGLISFNGDNKFSTFGSSKIANALALASVGISPAQSVHFTDDPNMAALFAWPNIYPDEYNTELVLREFRTEDIGKEVYYRTYGSHWMIYRTLTFHYNNYNMPISATLGNLYEIPPYSCMRFTVNRVGSNTEGTSVSILEIA